MRSLCLKKILFVCLLPFCALLLYSLPVSALSLTGVGEYKFSGTVSYAGLTTGTGMNAQSVQLTLPQSSSAGNTATYSTNDNVYLNTLYLYRYNVHPSSDFPALVHFSVFYGARNATDTLNSSNVRYMSSATPRGASYALVGEHCSDDVYYNDDNTFYGLLCTYDLVFQSTLYNVSLNTDIYFDLSGASSNSQIFIYVSGYSLVSISNDSLGNTDKSWLSGDFLQAIKDAMEESNEAIKNEVQDSADSSETTTNSESSDASSAGTSLLSAFSQFVNVLTTTQPANNCELHIDLTNAYEDADYLVDLCSLEFPSYLSVIGTILMIAFVVPLSIATVSKLIALIRSFQT